MLCCCELILLFDLILFSFILDAPSTRYYDSGATVAAWLIESSIKCAFSVSVMCRSSSLTAFTYEGTKHKCSITKKNNIGAIFSFIKQWLFSFSMEFLLIQICQLNNKLKIETSLETKDILNQQFSDSFAINLSNVDNCTYRQISNVVNSKI